MKRRNKRKKETLKVLIYLKNLPNAAIDVFEPVFFAIYRAKRGAYSIFSNPRLLRADR